ncbi:sulfatase-like hydrolase/transferase [Chromobacterium violaceum]|uniref:sulfatase-like hydrolase/transferase n=1 Tax=Chromobacterium violaceum TaxID=536 RepID=UPI0009B83E7D|nr:sulfatase-like hydrolase/transferase [Chromobacterium violaceum]
MNVKWEVALKSVARFLMLFAVMVMAFGCYWVRNKFGEITWEQLLFHLQIAEDGLADADAGLIRSFVRQMGWALLVTILLMIPIRGYASVGRGVSWCLAYCRVGVRKGYLAARDWRVLALMLAGTLLFAGETFGALGMLERTDKGELFGKHYVDPSTVELQPHGRRNLVLVYVESLEEAYANAKIFDRNLLKDLQELPPPAAGSKIAFSDMYQSVGTGWTIAGIVSTQCGVPLHSVLLGDGNRQGEMVSKFMPGATCLSDVLKRHGYHNVFMHGPYNAFAGVGTFMRTHSYDEVYDRELWQQRYASQHINGWGLYDADLLNEGSKKFDDLIKKKQPFNLTLLTIDTHGPDGFLSPECQSMGYRGFNGVVECTASHVAKFVRHVQASPAAKNTTIVVMGDHLAMRNPVSDILAKTERRRVFNLLLTPERMTPVIGSVSRFDMLPTMLAAMGWEIPQNKLGLGYNAFSSEAAGRSKDWQQQLEVIAGNKSPRYLALWREHVSKE